MFSPYSGTSDLLQILSRKCFDAHPKKKVSHKRETKVRLWTHSSDMDIRGNQDVIPLEHVAFQR